MNARYVPLSLRRLVYARAKGCCEYCLIPEAATFATHEVDHIIAKKHGGLTEAENLALSCTLCNQHKGSDLASIDSETGKIAPLYHPRQNSWHENFELVNGDIIPLTPVGRVTVCLLRLNRTERVEERRILIKAGVLKLPKLK